MRFLIAHNEYGAMSGEEHALRAIVSLLKGSGHDVSLFLRYSTDILGIAGKTAALFSGIHNPHSVKVLKGKLRRQHFDAALVQNLYPLLSPSVLPLLRKFEIPVVMRCPNYRVFCPSGLHLSNGEICERCLGGREYWCVLRNCESDVFKSIGYALRNAMARITRRIVDNVNRFVVLTEFQRQRFVDGGISSRMISVVPNVAPEISGKASARAGELVSFVGRISTEKGIEEFIVAAGRLPQIPFAVAGDDNRKASIRKKSPSNVHWMGFLKGANLDDLFRRSRILVFPSKWYEGFPNVITRAMMHRKPVIASKLGGIPEIVEHERCGVLLEPGNAIELAETIANLYENPKKCQELGMAGRDKAETEYSPERVYRKWMEVFESAIRSKRER